MPGPKSSIKEAPLRPVRVGPSDVVSEERPDGSILVRSTAPLEPYPARLTERLEHFARSAPARAFLAQRQGDDC